MTLQNFHVYLKTWITLAFRLSASMAQVSFPQTIYPNKGVLIEIWHLMVYNIGLGKQFLICQSKRKGNLINAYCFTNFIWPVLLD